MRCCLNTDAPSGVILTQYANLDENDLVATVTVDTLMEEGYFTAGPNDKITLTFGGISRDFDFTVSELTVGNRTYSSGEYTEDGQSVTFSVNTSQGLSIGDDLSGVTLKILDEVGDDYTVTLENAGDYKYVPPMAGSETYTLNILGYSDKITGPPAYLVAFSGDEITYSLLAKDLYANMGYSLELKIGSSIFSPIPMELEVDDQGKPTGNPTDGYTYNAVVDIGNLDGIAQDDLVEVNRIIRDSTALGTVANHPNIGTTKTIKFFMGLQFASIEYEVLHSTYSNELDATDNTVYVVLEDIVFFEVELSDAIKATPEPNVTIAGLSGSVVSESIIDGYIDDPETFTGGCVYNLDSSGTKIVGVFQMPNLNTSTYKAEQAAVLSIMAEIRGMDTAELTIISSNPSHKAEGNGTFHNLTYWDPINPSQFSFTMTSNTRLEDDCITKGDQVRLQYTGITASAIASIEAGERSISPSGNISFPSGGQRFNLSQSNSEDYTPGSLITITMVVEHSSGKTYSIEIPAESAYSYIVRSSTPKDELEISFDEVAPLITDTTPNHYAISEYSKLSFSFTTNEVFPRDYSVVLATPGGASVEVELILVTDPKGSPISGYSYTGSINFSSVSGLEDFDVIAVSMTCDSSSLTFTDDLDGAELVYYGPFTLLGLNVAYPGSNNTFEWEPTDEYAYIIDGDFIKVTLRFNHSLVPEDTVISMDNVTGKQFTEAELAEIVKSKYSYKPEFQMRYHFTETNLPNDTVILYYRVPRLSDENYDSLRLSFQRENNDVYDYDDNVPITISVATTRVQVPGRPASLNTGDFGPKTVGGKELYHQMLYWAPLDIWNPEVTLLNLGSDEELRYDDLDEETYVIVRDGQDIRITFATKHQILIDEIVTKFSPDGTSSREAPEIDLTYTENQDGQSLFVYTASFTIGKDPVANIDDQTIIKFIWDITDARSQKTGNIKYSDGTKWAIYYKPLEITEVTITTSNRKDETQFCKDEDTITVSFMANHYVMVEGQTIIGRAGEYEDRRRRHREPIEYRFTYEIQNGDIEDLEFITFAFAVQDLAGDAFEFTDESAGVINRIKYYAPLEVTAEIESDNARPEYARNGDTVTISTTSNHEAQTLDFRLGSREIGDNETYREDPVVSYRIPDGEEEMFEGDLFFSVRLEDPAGNYELVSETAEEGEEGTKVTYDRTAPEIRILPGFNGFTNEDVGFTFMYSDMYLDLATVSCVLNDAERIRYASGTETSFSHKVELTEEGEYVVSAVAIDMAGNEMEFAAVCTLIIDKTEPVIKMQLGRNTFQAGFTLDNITSIVEDNLGSMVCTITDNQGVHDWSLDLPIEEEGKKTVYTLVRDMAGNTSTPIAYDIFIDATAPQPQVSNSVNDEQFHPEGKNFFVGSTARMSISLAPIFMGDEGPDRFTTLQLVDGNGNIVFDFLASPSDEHLYDYRLPDFGTYTLLVAAKDDVGNETGPLMYLIEFREQYLLERLLQNTPLAGLAFIRYINDTMFFIICAAFVLLVAGIATLVALRRRKKKKFMAQEYVIVDDE